MPLTEEGIEAKAQIIPFEIQATQKEKEKEKSDSDAIKDKLLSPLLQEGDEICIDINESEWCRIDENPRIKDLPVRLSYTNSTGEEKGDGSDMYVVLFLLCWSLRSFCGPKLK